MQALPSQVSISIIIPAYNVAKYISDALESLLRQSFSAWEAIVIDDGSVDNTQAVVAAFAERDSRISLIKQANQGVSVARNTGIQQSAYDWLLFLDADDWISPDYMVKMAERITTDPAIDAVVCDWARVDATGHRIDNHLRLSYDDLFRKLTTGGAFAIHACLVRKSLVKAVGGFEPSMRSCEDWDLWQRIARTGANFEGVEEVLAFYRMRPDSLSLDTDSFLQNSLMVIDRGHGEDNRLANLQLAYKEGVPGSTLTTDKIHFLSWIGGFILGSGKDATHILENAPNSPCPDVDPFTVAQNIFYAATLYQGKTLPFWESLWPELQSHLLSFLGALEKHVQVKGLAKRSLVLLERLIIQHIPVKEPLLIGTTYALQLEVTAAIPDILPPAGTERIYIFVQLEEAALGTLELPVCNNQVSAWLLTDAIAAQFAWPILGKFFSHSLYKELIPADAPDVLEEIHNRIGWTSFMQQVWGNAEWPENNFYNPKLNQGNTEVIFEEYQGHPIEMSADLPNLKLVDSDLQVLVKVGGVPALSVKINAIVNKVTAQALTVAINTTGGFEFCRVCVREALIGHKLDGLASLRERLAAAAESKRSDSDNLSAFAKIASPKSLLANTVLLGRRADPIGFSSSRRAILPASTAKQFLRLAQVTNEPVLAAPSSADPLTQVLYCPDLGQASTIPSGSLGPIPSNQGIATSAYGRQYFETLFSTQPDPWKYTHPYEQSKYELTLSLLPALPFDQGLEIACAEGHFTTLLAPKVKNLLAADISQVALERTAQRCQPFDHVSYRQLDLVKDVLPGQFDLIVCSEVLYYMGDLHGLKAVAKKIAQGLCTSGFFLTAHAHQIADDPASPGFDWGLPYGAKVIGEAFAGSAGLELVKEIRTPLYRVQLFQKPKQTLFSWLHRKKAEIIFMDQPTPVPPEVQDTVKWEGGESSGIAYADPVVTASLPILMYHRVAPTGAESLSKYRITPSQFEEQLQYLRDAGYHTPKWEDWLHAMSTRQPLPGRAIMLTFDDGYSDFYTHAWPLLQKYGFTAAVFLVADQIGKSNTWDEVYGEEIPLMDWPEILDLQNKGIVFGSHTASHSALTGLSPTDIVQEGVRSRTSLQQTLGTPVKIIAYPYGDTDQVVAHLAGACGYTIGLTCRCGTSTFSDNALLLPRIEVKGQYSLKEFVANLSL